jgi:hypothetical protein
MEIAKHTHAAVIVSSEWRHLEAVKLFVGLPENPSAVGDGSSLLEAQILDAIDRRGLWIELNTGQKKWPDRPVQKLMVPWKFILHKAFRSGNRDVDGNHNAYGRSADSTLRPQDPRSPLRHRRHWRLSAAALRIYTENV